MTPPPTELSGKKFLVVQGNCWDTLVKELAFPTIFHTRFGRTTTAAPNYEHVNRIRHMILATTRCVPNSVHLVTCLFARAVIG